MDTHVGSAVEERRALTVHAAVAGVMAALVGFSSSFAVVLAGLRAVGATPAQAASGLLALCLVTGVTTIWASRRYRIPFMFAWSTPGAALLVSTGLITGGWPAAVGAFIVGGGLILLTALWPRLGALISAIPTAIAQAMLAGVLLALCLAPMRALASVPLLVAPILVVWLIGLRFFRKWAVPAAFATTLVVIAIDVARTGGTVDLVPRLEVVAPTLTWQAVVSIAIPLYIVTMASQNIPGVAIMQTFGFTIPWRPAMTTAGIGTVGAALAGGHIVNLAAITAAMAASPEAHPDPNRRWVAGVSNGATYLVLGVASIGLAGFVALAPSGLVEAAAGLALLGTFAAAIAGALANADGREAAVVTFVVAASGIAFAGIGAAFWGLLAGLAVHAILRKPGAAPA